MDAQDFRKDIQEKIGRPESFPESYAALKEFLGKNRDIKEFHWANKLLTHFPDDPQVDPFSRTVRIALLSSYTDSFLPPLLEVDLMIEDLKCELYEPGFNRFRQEILDNSSGLYSFEPDMSFVSFLLEDVFPSHVGRFSVMEEDEKEGFFEQVISLCQSLVLNYHDNIKGEKESTLFFQDFIPPFQRFDSSTRADDSFASFVERLNREIEALCREHSNTYVFRYSKLVARHGANKWTDPRLYYTSTIPVAPGNWLHLSDAYVRHIKAALNIDVKCIILDLDNTLWGGILGEDGIDGIQLGDTYPGAVYGKFQQYLLDLYSDGYILAINSKNNMDDVLEVLRSHKWMALKETHFAAIMVNWREKADNLLAISKEINILPEHMLLVDDNPVEIEKVRLALPETTRLQLHSPPIDFVDQFDRLRLFGKLELTREDRRRGTSYSQERKRKEVRKNLGSLEEFYRTLSQRMVVHWNRSEHVRRISQLTQKTNQFNMTTIRLTEKDVERLLENPDSLLVTAELSDKFGDSGIIAFIQARKCGSDWQIDNFLMSCRVLGRTAEESLINHVAIVAKRRGAEYVRAVFVPTKKNKPFADFYSKNGFSEAETPRVAEENENRFICPLGNFEPKEYFVEIIEGKQSTND